MQRIGSFLIIIGLLAVILDFFNRVPRILAWIYEWGNGPAWAIKIGLIVLGAILYLMGGKNLQKD
ncbi:hypothetical protein SAMN04488128_103327 [Chitinophaga eiseniae]|uniref:Uncharacterized protein n=1 Tax=Chitinophaga eiseniae TaxID=634771 RepID=A0A1T4SRX0_9BACT|nr:hypothetical protein [Chitinophaga eiseniae]SKA30648.1 hypothetical protein SAMN04488128_103327 [Chitinophaga eiseniae]